MSESLGSSLCSICKNICLTSFIHFFDTKRSSEFLHYPSMRGHHARAPPLTAADTATSRALPITARAPTPATSYRWEAPCCLAWSG